MTDFLTYLDNQWAMLAMIARTAGDDTWADYDAYWNASDLRSRCGAEVGPAQVSNLDVSDVPPARREALVREHGQYLAIKAALF